MGRSSNYLFIALILLLAGFVVAWAAPAPVGDLAASSAGYRHITLTWSTPYDAAASTTPAYYDLRCSTTTPIITAADWNNCPSSPVYPYNIVFTTQGVSAGSPVSFSVTGLTNGRTYFFAIKSSTDNISWSALDTSSPEPFNTPFNTVPYTLQSYDFPAARSEVYTSTPTLTWHSDTVTPGSDDSVWGDSIVTYTVELSTDVSFGFHSSEDVSIPSYTTYPLAENTTYYWRVRPHDSEGLQSAGFLDQTDRWFMVNAKKDAPTPFNLLLPANLDIINNNTPSLQWSASTCADPMPEGIVSYTVQYSTSPTFNIVCTTTVAALAGSPYAVPSALIENAHYFWRVYAVSGSGVSTMSSSTGTFWVNAIHTGPGIFAPAGPPNASIVRLSTPTISWSPSADPDPGSAVVYNVIYSSTDITLSMDYHVISGIGTTWYVLPPLQDGVVYWWQVQSDDGAGGQYQSTEWSFSVHAVNAPPTPFDLLSASGTVATLKPAFSWQAATDPEGDAFSYTVQYTTTDFSAAVSSAGLHVASFTPAVNLTENAQYLWRVMSVDSFGAQRMSNQTWPLAINANPEPPLPFSLVSPADQAQISYLAPTLIWQATTDPDPGDSIAGYTVRYSTAPDLSNAVSVAGISVTSYTVTPPLTANTTYFWSVRAVATQSGQTDAAAIRSFFAVNQPPLAFSLLAPSGIIATRTPTLNWQAAPDPEGDAVTYTVRYATNAAFAGAVSVSGITNNYYTTPALIEDASYYWKVDAVDVWGHVRNSTNVLPIAINSIDSPPAVFVLISPPDGTVCGVRPVFSWQASSDTDPGDRVSYELWYSTSPVFAFKTVVASLPGTSYTTVQSLIPGTTVYWKVSALDNAGNRTMTTAWRTYISQAEPPETPANFTAMSSADGRTITLTWQAPGANADGSALTPLDGFCIYRAYDLNGVLASVTPLIIPAGMTSYTEQIAAGQTVYYQVSARNILGGESTRSRAVSAGAQGELLSYTNDCDLILSCPPNVVPSSYSVTVSRDGALEFGNVLRHYSVHVAAGGVELKKYVFSKPLTISLKTDTAIQSPAAHAPVQAQLTTGIFWHNGVEWIYLGGENASGDISVRASSAGEYELRAVSRSSEFHVLSHWPAIITPNGDAINDEFNITFENPMSDAVSGEIYDLRGARIAEMSAKTDTWYIWNGSDDNALRVVPGIYIYQLKVGEKRYNGTVVVAR